MSYANFMMKLQEAILNEKLPADKKEHWRLRRTTVDALSEAVSKLVLHLAPEAVLEIGAHAAEFSRLTKAALPHSRVIAIEANPDVHRRHREEVTASGVEYINKCIADENKTYSFKVPIGEQNRERITMGSVLNFQPLSKFHEYSVDGQRLDDFLADVDGRLALWIDVEGAIGSVLGGAEKSLQRCDLLFAELEAERRWDGQMLDAEVIDRLQAYGLVPILRDIQRHKWQHNICFVREDLLSDGFVLTTCENYLTTLLRWKMKIPISQRASLQKFRRKFLNIWSG